MQRGELRVKHMPTGMTKFIMYKGCVANSMLRPCGLGCHMLGLRHTACLGTNLIHNHASNEITLCPAPYLRRTGEDDSPKPSCKYKSLFLCFNLHRLSNKVLCLWSWAALEPPVITMVSLGISGCSAESHTVGPTNHLE